MSIFEKELLFYCGTAMLGYKASDLVSLSKNKVKNLKEELIIYRSFLREKGIYFFILAEDEKRILLLVYRKNCLEKCLVSYEVEEMLKEYGYSSEWESKKKLAFLKYKVAKEKNFPHEIGLFLGYPIEDVRGFIKNLGKKEHYSGYWKVYGDVSKAKEQFSFISSLRSYLLNKLYEGATLIDLLAVA